MSAVKENIEPEADSDIEQAMQDAVQAIEKREKSTADEMIEVSEDDEEGIDLLVEDDSKEETPIGEEKTDAASAVTEALIAAKKELEGALEQTRTQYTQLKEKWMRAAADLENYKKRARREREEAVKFGNERVIKDLLPVIDDLDRTLEAVNMDTQEGNLQTVLDGIRMVQKKFLSQLEKHDVVSFESQGKAFDPARHEAVNQMHSNDVSAGGVLSEMRRGFFLSGRLLRPSLVTVSLGPENPKEEGAPTDKEAQAADSNADEDANAPESSEAESADKSDESPEDLESGE